MNRKLVWISVAFCALVLSYLVLSSFRPKAAKCEVCMEFRGLTDCRIASADNREHALRTAISNACAQLSSGVIESSQCENTPPRSVRWLR
jgi:hypothetical protein